MPPASPASPPLPASSRLRRLLRRALFLALGLFILLAAVFFLLPVWISNEQGRLYVLDRLNDRLHGPRVAVDDWKLGWFRTTELTNFRIYAPDGTTIVSCPQVSSGITLWDIFWSNYDIRNTTADKLEFRLAKNADGTTSLDSLALGASDILQSTRGALQINHGQITIYSARCGQSVRYSDAKATLSIASPDAPFHIQISAVGTPDVTLALTATLPPTSSLSVRNLSHPGIWALASSLDLDANHLPTALACDFVNIDAAWVDSFGDTLDNIQFSAHAPPLPAAANSQNTTRLALLVRGTARRGEPAAIDARLLLHPPAADGTGGSLSLASGDYRLAAALRQSPPLARLLARLNPLLGEISTTTPAAPAAAAGLVRATASSFALPFDHPEAATADLRVTFPPLLFTTHDGPSLLRQLQVTLGDLPRANARIEGAAEPLRVSLADGQFHYENFLITLASAASPAPAGPKEGARRINFTGNVSLDHKLDLSASLPDTTAGLTSSITQVIITGTTETPILKRAE